LALEPPPELVEEARLAEPRIADHGDDLRLAPFEPPETRLELRQLLVAPHERRQAALGGDRHGRRGRALAQDLVGRHRLALALDHERPGGPHLKEPAYQPGGAPTRQDRAPRG